MTDFRTFAGHRAAAMHQLKLSMREPQPKAIQLKDYTPPAFSVETVDLDVDIRSDDAIVKAKLQIRRNAPGPLVLDGDELELQSVTVDG